MLTIDDLPKFSVLNVAHSEPGADGYVESKLHGVFDHTGGVKEGNGWLLLPERDCLYGQLEPLDVKARTATFKIFEKEEPKAKGQTFPYLDGYWQAYHVWMVTEPLWKWREVTFQPSDAMAERLPSDGSLVGGERVKEWISLRKVGDPRGKRHVYPVYSQGPRKSSEINADGVVPLGWDHEHCELCTTHIKAGDVAFVDLSDHWVCKACYSKYVATHDLSFLNG